MPQFGFVVSFFYIKRNHKNSETEMKVRRRDMKKKEERKGKSREMREENRKSRRKKWA